MSHYDNSLEYGEEDDLFGSDAEINPAAAIQSRAGVGASANASASTSAPTTASQSQSLSRPTHTDHAQTTMSTLKTATTIGTQGSDSTSNAASNSRRSNRSPTSRRLAQSATSAPNDKASRSNHPATNDTAASTGRVYKDVDERLRELREKKRLEKEEYSRRESAVESGQGVQSLKVICMGVIKVNSSRIEDIGDLEYPIIKPFVDDLPMEQLSSLETACPHIKKDTDWLWEIFLIQTFPLFHERCQDRRGEMRTSGWRRMYKKAQEDLEERHEQAVAKMSARYKEMADIKASKSIVVMDEVMPDKKRAKSGWGNAAPRAPQGPIAKARADAQRTRIALTHASGRYIPPPPPRPSASAATTNLFKNPYLASSSSPASASSSRFSSPHGPGGPGPDRTRVFPKPDASPYPASSTRGLKTPRMHTVPRQQEQQRDSSSSRPQPNLIPGSYRTSESNQARLALPPHLRASARSASASASSTEAPKERFRIGGPDSTPKYREIRKPVHPKFEAPTLQKEQEKNPNKNTNRVDIMNFFGVKPAAAIAPAPKLKSKPKNADANTNTNLDTPAQAKTGNSASGHTRHAIPTTSTSITNTPTAATITTPKRSNINNNLKPHHNNNDNNGDNNVDDQTQNLNQDQDQPQRKSIKDVFAAKRAQDRTEILSDIKDKGELTPSSPRKSGQKRKLAPTLDECLQLEGSASRSGSSNGGSAQGSPTKKTMRLSLSPRASPDPRFMDDGTGKGSAQVKVERAGTLCPPPSPSSSSRPSTFPIGAASSNGADEAKKLESLLFRKKKKVVKGGR